MKKYLVEIENIIYKINGIKEVAVLGVPDVIMGEPILVYVTVHDNAERAKSKSRRMYDASGTIYDSTKSYIFILLTEKHERQN